MLRSYVQSVLASSSWKWQLGGTRKGVGGDKSVPVTMAEGNLSAKSIAQMPEPAPTSRTRWGFSTGAW